MIRFRWVSQSSFFVLRNGVPVGFVAKTSAAPCWHVWMLNRPRFSFAPPEMDFAGRYREAVLAQNVVLALTDDAEAA